MFSIAEAKGLLAELPKDDPAKALEEITSWLESVTATPDFKAELRIDLIRLLDETGQPLQAELLKKYLAEPHLQDFQGMHLWQRVHLYTRELSRAYEECMAACQREMKPYEQQELLPLLSVRLLRAIAEHMKLELMRYMDVGTATWERMYRCYGIAESRQFARTMLFAYPGYAIHTSSQHELVRALVLYVSSPGNLAPDQIEVAFRIAGRMVSFFDLTTAPDVSSEYCFDFAQPVPPKPMDETIVATPTMRYFSPLRALPRISEIIRQHERGGSEDERRFGSEFTPKGKLTVLKHLLVYWNKFHPRRALARRGISANVEVAHGFRTIGHLIPRIDLNQTSGLTQEEASALTARANFSVVAEGGVEVAPETWTIVDASMSGLGGLIPRAAGAWVKVGALIGLRPQNVQTWWVSVIRRLHTDQAGIVHVGIEILGRKSLAVWLRVLGKGAERVSNWETSSGSFKYDYFPAVLLPDAQNSYINATMLLESGSYAEGKVYEIMLGEKSRDIELTGLLAEGEDYELVKFSWLVESHTR
ncbi:MAG TPA: hypothetical protein VIU46_04420 [Gallionellaceae bacterium]